MEFVHLLVGPFMEAVESFVEVVLVVDYMVFFLSLPLSRYNFHG